MLSPEKKHPKIGVISPKTRPSWCRALEKYRPSTQLLLSPVKQIQCVLEPIDKDQYVSGFAWILSMSEQFYYENSMNMLVSKSETGENCGVIMMNNIKPINLEYMMKSWEDINILGYGTYGSVYKIYDNIEQEYIAIKHLKKLRDDAGFGENTMKIMEYLKERYYLMQAYDSPFVIKFKYSFQINDVNGLFLATDYCLCDMSHFMYVLKNKSQFDMGELLMAVKRHTPTTLDDLHKKISDEIELNIQDLIIVHTFELFSILDFLGKCNIVHRDIKPQNVMIGPSGHLKLGDFGLVNNTRFMYNRSLYYLVKHDEIKGDPMYKPAMCGTVPYMDIESYFMEIKDTKLMDALKKESGFVKPSFDYLTYTMDFLTDLWAVGIMISELLLLGRALSNSANWSHIHMQVLGLTGKSMYYDYAKILYVKRNYEMYFIRSFNSLANGRLKEIVQLLPSIFSYKDKGRLSNYTKSITLNLFNKKFKTDVIDIEKINSMSIFQSQNINTNSVRFYEFPKQFIYIINQLSKVNGPETSRDLSLLSWIQQLQEESKNAQKMFAIEPGCTLTHHGL